jgi:hypothetical protein
MPVPGRRAQQWDPLISSLASASASTRDLPFVGHIGVCALQKRGKALPRGSGPPAASHAGGYARSVRLNGACRSRDDC